MLLHFTSLHFAGLRPSLPLKLVTWAILIKTGLLLRSSVEYYAPCKTADDSHSDEIGHTLASVSTFLKVNLKLEQTIWLVSIFLFKEEGSKGRRSSSLWAGEARVTVRSLSMPSSGSLTV